MTARTHDSPVCPEPKTRLLYANLGLPDASFDAGRLDALAQLLRDPGATRACIDTFRFPDTGQLARDTDGHFAVLARGLAR